MLRPGRRRCQPLFIISTLIICYFLCAYVVDSNGMIKSKKKWNTTSSPSAAIQQRRGKIIKCCGKDSCTNPQIKNVTKLHALLVTTLVAKTKNRVTSKKMTLPTAKTTTASVIYTQIDETLEASSSQSVSAAVEKFYFNLSTEPTTEISTEMEPNTVATTTLPDVLSDCSIQTCQRNDSLFELDGTLIDSQKYGSWRDVCGELYLFGKKLVNWDENVHRCCSIGMQPITFETEDQFKCILNITKSNWPYNLNYWTSGQRTNSSEIFQWCLGKERSYFNGSGPMWAPQQPDNRNKSEDCVHLTFPKILSRTGLTDKNCDYKFVLGCKGSTTRAPKCHAPACPNITCVNNNTFFTVANDTTSMFLTDPKVHGTWINIKGRIYMFSNSVKIWQDAASACCAIGTKLLSVDNDYEYGLLTEAITQTNGAVVSDNFWTSATDEGCDGAFGWCSVNRLVKGAIWASKMPEIGKRCVTVEVNATNTTLKTNECSAELHYICETRDLGNATSGGKALKDECAAIYNISEAEQDSIFNGSSYSQKVKCFLKCLGENGGVVWNGYLVDDALIKLAESLATNDTQQLQSDLMAVETCAKIKGMDECDTAALTFQCGLEEAPVLVANAISSVELSKQEISPIQPPLGICISDYTCITNQEKAKAFETFKPLDDGFIETRCGIKYFISKPSKAMTYREAATKCCEYGLSILALDSPNELKCLAGGFLGGRVRPYGVWTSASRIGSPNNQFRWCTSKMPLNASQFTWSDKTSVLKNSLLLIYMNKMPADAVLDPQTVGTRAYVICKKQYL